jgi:DNA mismatch repair protein MutL
MQSVIKILPQFIANRISAGEVIGRPEAVVKELIENSIDAKAENIELIIKDAGKTLIQVIDDGTGMSEDDALMCFQRHSTSKISEAEDLENIKTLGFRGEALASISAIAQVELKTQTADSELGILIKNHGSEIIESVPSTFTGPGKQGNKGTSVSVRNLFFNTPARRNFLKTNQTEFKHIYDTFLRQAIANPAVSFRMVNDEEQIFDLQKSDLQNRLIEIYGLKYAESLVEVNQETELISLKGFISKPSFTKKSKQDQFLFLNNRYVTSKSLSYAVHLAYDDLIDKGDYPNFFLFLSLDTHMFDVNVHPSKLEVKFDDEKAVFGFIKKGVWNTLQQNDLTVSVDLGSTQLKHEPEERESNIIPSYRFTKDSSKDFSKEQSFRFDKQGNAGTGASIHEMFGGKQQDTEGEIKSNDVFDNNSSPGLPSGSSASSFDHVEIDDMSGKNSIWQFQRKYIMYQMENTLMIIDQHAAHERILYELAVDRLNSNANLSQQLLIPLYIDLNPVDYEVAKSIEGELKALGFDIELQSKRKIKIKGIPSDVKLGHEDKILQELIDEFKENDVKLNLDKRDNLAKSYACKHAIKAGDKLNPDEMLNLIDKLFYTKMPYVCPHGRPTVVKISMDELDKKFARTGF